MATLSGGLLLCDPSPGALYLGEPTLTYTWTAQMAEQTTMPLKITRAEAKDIKAPCKQKYLMHTREETFDCLVQFDTLPTDKLTLSSLLRKCGDAAALSQGKRLHNHIMHISSLAKDTLLGNLLVQMYSKCNSLNNALDVFANIQHKNVYSWSLILGACIQHGQRALALDLFHQMRREGMTPDEVTYVTILDACNRRCTLSDGESIHAEVIENGFAADVFVGTALVSMYGRCDDLDAARLMFERMPSRSVVSWNAISAVCIQAGNRKRALKVFHLMMQEDLAPSNLSFLSALEACNTLQEAQTLHDCICRHDFESDILVSTALITMYGKLGRLDDAREVFESIEVKTDVAWSAMIAAYAQHSRGKEALELFHVMKLSGVSPTQSLLTSALSVCAIEALLGKGELIYAHAVCLAMDRDFLLINSLIDMYANCGHLKTAQEIFDKMCVRDVSSWNVIIGAHALYGNATNALELFQEMIQKDTKPDAFTFSNLLSGCSHAGFVNEAHFYLLSMQPVYGVIQMVGHYNCIIDLLGRVGRLDESEYLINHMPVDPTSSSWMSLFSGCKLHNDIWRANRAVGSLLASEHKSSGPCVILSQTLELLSC